MSEAARTEAEVEDLLYELLAQPRLARADVEAADGLFAASGLPEDGNTAQLLVSLRRRFAAQEAVEAGRVHGATP